MHNPIRSLRIDDLDAVASLSGQLGYPTAVDAIRARFEEIAASPSKAAFVAVDQRDRVVGWIQVERRVLLESGPFAEIVGLVVDDGQRGRGVGRALVQRVESWAIQCDLADIRVRSNVVREDARRFYERIGYSVTKQQSVFVRRLTA
ncbi:MAG: GNAT family N-acetyltransferase [Phycisphaerales bacterium]|nr:GNAT family N-acetyltransferase [Phycisphaerales bacterium]MCB9863677.1 GNAT family N-acetyltransferase [Phycisphaerales bacterium]